MVWIDKFCNSSELTKEERILCYQRARDFHDIMTDLDKKGYLRSDLRLKRGEEGRMNSEYVLENLREITDAFNKFAGIYTDKKTRKKFLELSKSYGLTEENLRYAYFSEMIFVFLQNIEAFRVFFLFIIKPNKDKYLNQKTALGRLLRRLRKLGIDKSDTLIDVDYELRNALSHGLFWLDAKKDSNDHKPCLKYATDLSFKQINKITIADLHSKMRKQAIYTVCLIYVIGDWFG